jgi:hypothetical protein
VQAKASKGRINTVAKTAKTNENNVPTRSEKNKDGRRQVRLLKFLTPGSNLLLGKSGQPQTLADDRGFDGVLVLCARFQETE